MGLGWACAGLGVAGSDPIDQIRSRVFLQRVRSLRRAVMYVCRPIWVWGFPKRVKRRAKTFDTLSGGVVALPLLRVWSFFELSREGFGKLRRGVEVRMRRDPMCL
jgi:hypothetical protein